MVKTEKNKLIIEIASPEPIEELIRTKQSILNILKIATYSEAYKDLSGDMYFIIQLIENMELEPEQINLKLTA